VIINGVKLRSKSFRTAEEAAHAYDDIARVAFGSDAHLIFPEVKQVIKYTDSKAKDR